MPRRLTEDGRPLLDVASYARRGPGHRDRLSPAEIECIARTVNRAPEVMVKVLTQGGQSLGAVRRHLRYLNRVGELALETDDGRHLEGHGTESDLLDDWDLDLDEHRRRLDLRPSTDRRPPKLVHKLLFSMPPGTHSRRVLAAVESFAREEFALKHRYALVLHTDEPHPHVHMVVKAMSEQGERLHIRKATLRRWRAEFARHLRALGAPANATERAVRGTTRPPKLDGIYRAARRGQSTHVRRRLEMVVNTLRTGDAPPEPGGARVRATRNEVKRGWWAVSDALISEGRLALAAQVQRFLSAMAPARTERQWLAEDLRRRVREATVQARQPAL